MISRIWHQFIARLAWAVRPRAIPMTSCYRWILLVFLASVLVTPAVAAAQSDDDGHLSPSKEWPLVHGDWTNRRYSTLSEINTNTAKNPGGAGMWRKFEDGAWR